MALKTEKKSKGSKIIGPAQSKFNAFDLSSRVLASSSANELDIYVETLELIASRPYGTCTFCVYNLLSLSPGPGWESLSDHHVMNSSGCSESLKLFIVQYEGGNQNQEYTGKLGNAPVI